MLWKIFNVLLTLTFTIYLANGQHHYELEFLDAGIFKACEQYPDNFIDQLFDLTNLRFEQTEDGTLIVKGYVIAKTSIEPPLQGLVETFKKERGTWQPTILTQKRVDLCTAAFDESESWYPYFKNTPKEQQKCPIAEGQRIDFDISEPTILTAPTRNSEGEYNIHVEARHEGGDLLYCVDVVVMAHKVENKHYL